jgi:hypothetical protein
MAASRNSSREGKLAATTRRANMRTIETLPGELNASIISSIINLVCPQCGGSMMEFQCGGRCRGDWLLEWEWAIHTTRKSQATIDRRLPADSRW